jgi:tRNA pseudouridine synthase 10
MSERLEIAGRALQRPLCNHCLGRLFASVSRGLSNEQRGFMVRMAVDGAPKEPVSPADCGLCGGLFTEIPKFSEMCVRESRQYEFSTFLVGTKIDAELVENEEAFWTEIGVKESESLKAEMNREIGKTLEKALAKTVDFANPEMVFLIDTRFDKVALDVAPLFIYGRYRKFSRELPQTRWPCRECRGKGCPHCGGKGRMYETSVQDYTGPVAMHLAGGEDDFFHGMGREDIDARMLGNGRPFVMEVRKPRSRTIDFAELGRQINEGAKGIVEVEGLRKSSRAEMQAIKGSTHPKTYRVRVRFQTTLGHGKLNQVVTSLAGKPISQLTPNRVAHRRANIDRHRTIRRMEVESVNGPEVVFVVEADSGTYIKELMHGDEGRTQPNVAAIVGVPCEVIELDVIAIGDQGA